MLHVVFTHPPICPHIRTHSYPWSHANTASSVLSYSTSNASLVLGHDYPRDTGVSANVDVHLLLENIGYEETRVGEWVNVVGYVRAKRRGGTGGGTGGQLSVHVEALLVWPTGPLDVQRYERTFAPEGA